MIKRNKLLLIAGGACLCVAVAITFAVTKRSEAVDVPNASNTPAGTKAPVESSAPAAAKSTGSVNGLDYANLFGLKDALKKSTGPSAYPTSLPKDAIRVSTPNQLTEAIAAAKPGTTILLADGTYTQATAFNVTGINGTETSPIMIVAEHQGKAIIAGNLYFNVSKSSYVTIQGLKFTNQGHTAVALDGSNHIRVTRNTFALTENGKELKWLVVSGANSHHNWIDHNEFGPRQDLGQMIAFQGGPGGQMSQYDVIEYNYFHDFAPQKTNGGETIRVGLSGVSMADGYITIQNNLFIRCDGDSEVVSVKSGHNIVRYNTFVNNKAQVTSRHGHANTFNGNYFFGDGVTPKVGGLRIYANDQRVFNNYFQNLTTNAIEIPNGDYDAGSDGKNYTSAVLAQHWRLYRAQIVNNTIVNSKSSIVVGEGKFAPVDSRVANNIVVGASGPLYKEGSVTNTVFEGNIGYGGMVGKASRTPEEIRNLDPLLTTIDGILKLSSTSPAIDAAIGSYAFVTDDMDGQTRSKNDIGADEYAIAAINHKPLTTVDVGPDAP